MPISWVLVSEVQSVLLFRLTSLLGSSVGLHLTLQSVTPMTVPCFSPLPVFIDRKGSGKPVPGPWAHPDDSQGENPGHQNRPPADQGALHGPDEERAAWHSTSSAAAALLIYTLS